MKPQRYDQRNDLERKVAAYSAAAAALLARAVKVVAPLLPYLPDGRAYRILFMERDLDEVLASPQRMLTRLGRPSGNPAVLKPAFEAQLRRVHARAAAVDARLYRERR